MKTPNSSEDLPFWAEEDSTTPPERKTILLAGELPSVVDQLSDPALLHSDMTVGVRNGQQWSDVYQVTEREVAEDFADFLAKARTVAQDDESQEGQQALIQIDRLAQTPFLSAEARRRAIAGIADHYAQELQDNPTKHVFFYVDPRYLHKSPDLISRELVDVVAGHGQGMAERVHRTTLFNEEALEEIKQLKPEDFRFLLSDDWLINASQMREQINRVVHLFKENKLEEYIPAIEIALVVARKDQLENGPYMANIQHLEDRHGISPIPMLAYYYAPEAQPFSGPLTTGSHSAADRGFSEVVGEVRRYAIERTGRNVERPLITEIPKRYDYAH